ncbi:MULTISPECIES: hypothetical protein [Sphingobium]|uniref:hypothetical protein n=1 Tax=Sphingobium TaxID=165695 RepID=UPI0011AE7720|nr:MULTISPECIES: hypothetical protein [Sphingobium]KAA9010907.1 hypothetical protein F4U94_22075 [Sphingobium limneticum]
MKAIAEAIAELIQYVGLGAFLARLVAVEQHMLTEALAVEQMSQNLGTSVAVRVATQFNTLGSGCEPFQAPGLEYHKLLQQGAKKPEISAI